MKIIKKQDDTRLGMKVLRISIGGNEEVGYYMTYRGDIEEITDLLEKALIVAESITEEPEISPDEGKMFA